MTLGALLSDWSVTVGSAYYLSYCLLACYYCGTGGGIIGSINSEVGA